MFAVGKTFGSFDELEQKIQLHERKSYVSLRRSESRTIDAAIKRKRIKNDRVKNDSLKYYEIRYTCVHEGENFKSRGKGERSSNTFQMGCPFFIALRVTKDGNFLSVTSNELTHANHERNQETFRYYPKVRKLNSEEREYAEGMITTGVNKINYSNNYQARRGKPS